WRTTTRARVRCTSAWGSPRTKRTTTIAPRKVRERHERARTWYAPPVPPAGRALRGAASAVRRGGPLRAARPVHAVSADRRGGGRHAGRRGHGRHRGGAGPAGR